MSFRAAPGGRPILRLGGLTSFGRISRCLCFLNRPFLLRRYLGGGNLNRLGNGLCDQLDRPNRIIIARDRIVDQIRIGIRVGNGDDRNPEAMGLGNRDALSTDIHDEDGAG